MPNPRSIITRLLPHLPLAALILLAVYPILSDGLPTTGDGLNHFYRFAELNWHIGQGDVYPRWFSNLHFGYGAPLFNFYAPLSYYIPLVFRIVGLPLTTSLQLGYVLALAVAMVGAYRWGISLFGEQGASFGPLLVAGAYGLAPYFYLNIFHRGAYPETWALAFAPWLLWAAHKLVVQPKSRTALFGVTFFLSAIILTHTLSALILLPIATLYFLITLLTRLPLTTRVLFAGCAYQLPLSRFALAVIFALALTAFFTLPVLLESQFIQLNRTYSTGDLDYHRNFLTLATLLSAPPNYDPLLVFNSMPPSLGWPQALLAVVAIVVVVRNRNERKAVWALGLLTLVICVLPLGFTEPLWNLFPFSRFIQFPWRLVGPASLLVAGVSFQSVMASQTLKEVVPEIPRFARNDILRAALLLVVITACFLFSLSWTYHADFGSNAPASDSPADTIRYEIANGQLGTSSTGEYLPRDVVELPDPEAVLVQFANTDVPSRLVPPPADVTYTATRLSPTSETVTYTASQSLSLTYNLFYFPGWVAAVDNAPVEVRAVAPHGLITIEVPAGTHTLKLYRQLTLPEGAGIGISLITFIGLVIYGVRAIARRTATPQNVSIYASSRLTIVVSLFILALLASRVAYFDRAESVFHHTDPIPNPISVNFNDQLELVGYEVASQVVSGDVLPVALYWKAIQPLSADYSVSVQLADGLGNRFGQSDSQHPNGVPTSRWGLEQYARDSHSLLSLSGTPPGNYQLLVTVYSDTPLSILQDGSPIGVEYALGTVQVIAPTPLGSGPLAFTSADLASTTVSVGNNLAFTTLWFTGDTTLPPLMAQVELKDDANSVLYSETLPPAGPNYPTDQWVHNTNVRYPLSITLPATLKGGAAHVWLSLVAADGGVAAGPYDLGAIQIVEPERSFQIPNMQVRVDHDFGGAVRLLGYDLSEDSTTLYWQSLEPLSTRLTVFIHGLDANGTFVYGHDAQPLRPTTSWLPGEVITDVHPIVITDRFEVGLYDPISGLRFGETFVTRR